MRRVETDLSKLDELIARQYEDKIRGFAKDTFQNSWEARICRKKGTDFKMVYQFFKDLDGVKNVLMLEDSGTCGMDDERWKAFHSHWISTKGSSYLGGIGRWGQGKTLLLYFSSINTIITESMNDKSQQYRYSIRNNVGYLESQDKPAPTDPVIFKNKDGSVRKINDFFPSIIPLNHHGTRIWILDIKEDLAAEIEKGELLTQLSESWWEIIRNYNIPIDVIINGNIQRVQLPQFPETIDSEEKSLLSIDGDHGKIKHLKIKLAKSPIKPELTGIAIQRGGMTVLRYSLPTSAPDNLRERCYGYCQFDEKLDEEMWAIEMANHEGFESRKAVWVKLRRCIDSIAENFILKHSKTKEEEPLPLNFDDIIKTINKLVEEHLEGLGKGGHTTPPGPPPPPIPQKPICISPWGYAGQDKRFDTGDVLQPKGALRNNTADDVYVNFECWIESKAGSVSWSHKIDDIKIESNSKFILPIPDVELSKLSLKKGIHYLKATIRDGRKQVLHSRSATFYFEEDPPILGGWLSKIILGKLGGPKVNHRNLPLNIKGELLINIGYPEIIRIWRSQTITKKDKVNHLTPIFINVALSEAVREVMLHWWEDDTIQFDIGEIKRSKDIFDEMWADYIRGR